MVIILAAVAVGGFLLLNSHNNTVNNVAVVSNNTSSSVEVEKVTSEDVSYTQQSSSDDSKYVSKEYAQQRQDLWQSGKGYYWVGDTQYDSATGKIMGGGSAQDQQALREVYGDRT